MIALFWLTLGLILFSLFGYGALWILLARLAPVRPRPAPTAQAATILIAARNEERHLGAKLESILSQDPGPHDVDVLVVSDGSEDGTVAVAQRASDRDHRIKVVELTHHGGKAEALNCGLAMICPDRIVIFSDANSLLLPGAVTALLAPFSDPRTGGSIGQLDIPNRGGLMDRAERMFWRYDNALKAAEDRVAGCVSAQGTLYAVRRSLIGQVPADMADDLAISLGVVDRGYRLAFADGARASETVTSNLRGEFGRRVRSTERGWRGLMAHAHLMNPVRTGFYAPQLFCHKLLRRLVAFMLPLLFVVNLMVLDQGPVYLSLFLAQVALIALAGLAVTTRLGRRIPGGSATVMFVFGHAAIFYAILRYALGVRSTKWSPVRS